MRYIFTLILISLIFIGTKAQQAEEWNLARCIQHAIENNIDLKIRQNIQEKATIYRQQSQMNLLPSLNGWGNSSFDFRRSTNQNNEISSGPTYNVGYGISSSLKLFAGFTSMNAIAAYRYNELAGQEGTKQAVYDLVIAVNELFAQVIYQKEMVEVVKEQLKISQTEAERISATIQSGLLEEVAKHEIDATVSGNQLLLSRTENEYKLMKLNLAQLIEIPENTNFTVASTEFDATLPVENPLTASDIYSMACGNYPSILEKEFEMDYYRKQLHIAKGNLAPSLTLSGGYSSSFYSTDTLANGRQTPIGTQFHNYLNPSVGLSLNLPIFSGRSRWFQLKRSRIDLENALYNLESQKKQIRREIEQAVLRLSSFLIEYQHASDNLKHAEQSFETYREKFRLGLINTTDFMSAQNQLAQAKTDLLLARYSWIVQQQTLQLYQGKINYKF